MKFINCSYDTFEKRLENRKIIQFGASSAWGYFFSAFPNIKEGVLDNTICIVDNAVDKQGSYLEIGSNKIKIEAPDILKSMKDYVILIIVSIKYQEKICMQLEGMGLDENIECYSLPLMTLNLGDVDNSVVQKYLDSRDTVTIPKTIHSFWFSGEEKPELYKRCIDSWYKYCPDFEIIEWTTKNYDINKNKYMVDAYERRKWAFISDYARLDVIYNQGGIYLDMDVELVTSLAPYLVSGSFFCRQEDGMIDFGSGFGAAKGNALIGEMLSSYKDRRYILPDGTVDKTAQPELMNPILIKNGILNSHDSQVVGDSLILSNDYISCYTSEKTLTNAKLGIHWHNGSWLEEKDKKNIKDAIDARDSLVEKYFSL